MKIFSLKVVLSMAAMAFVSTGTVWGQSTIHPGLLGGTMISPHPNAVYYPPQGINPAISFHPSQLGVPGFQGGNRGCVHGRCGLPGIASQPMGFPGGCSPVNLNRGFHGGVLSQPVLIQHPQGVRYGPFNVPGGILGPGSFIGQPVYGPSVIPNGSPVPQQFVPVGTIQPVVPGLPMSGAGQSPSPKTGGNGDSPFYP